jgi:BirA family biotin operon repressor/biotin-[acetyl-CoA-carboxylase] ligase
LLCFLPLKNFSFEKFSFPTLQSNTFFGFFVGQKLVSLPRVDSTNNYLKEQLTKVEPVPEGTVIMAEEQFSGRGQSNNVWVAEPGKNLTFSILFNPSFISPDNQFWLNKAVSTGINDALYKIIGDDLKIKWPNDIYVKNKKLGGVLIENIIQGRLIRHTIVGVGINVNQDEFPNELKNVTSLIQILHRNYNVLDLLADVCKAIEHRYLQLKEGYFDGINKTYLENLYGLNRELTFEVAGKIVRGKITGVDQRGLLEVDFQGRKEKFANKQIAFIM